jgi:uncharacterized protein with HEPN domain
MKDDKLYLIHIAECIERIESYVSGVDKKEFMNSSFIQDAVIRNLQVMAESSQRLSDRIKQTQTEIDWYKIAGLRNVLVHDYLGIDMETVWNIVENEIPALKKAVHSTMNQNTP